MNVRQKRIYLNEGHTKYCVAKLYKTRELMRQAYKDYKPSDGCSEVSGAHCPFKALIFKKKKRAILSPHTGILFLNLQDCGAGIICHEIAHAVLWAHKHKRHKEQYPIVIKDMDEEEEILYHLTYAIRQFYNWYWEIKKLIK